MNSSKSQDVSVQRTKRFLLGRGKHPNTQIPITAELFEIFALALELLEKQSTNETVLPGQWEDLRQILEALPLSSPEFSVGVNRLENVHRYFQQEENGAAMFELRLLQRRMGALRQEFSSPAV